MVRDEVDGFLADIKRTVEANDGEAKREAAEAAAAAEANKTASPIEPFSSSNRSKTRLTSWAKARRRRTRRSHLRRRRTDTMASRRPPTPRKSTMPSKPWLHGPERQPTRYREGQRQPSGRKMRRWMTLLRTISRCRRNPPLASPPQTCGQCFRLNTKKGNNYGAALPPVQATLTSCVTPLIKPRCTEQNRHRPKPQTSLAASNGNLHLRASVNRLAGPCPGPTEPPHLVWTAASQKTTTGASRSQFIKKIEGGGSGCRYPP